LQFPRTNNIVVGTPLVYRMSNANREFVRFSACKVIELHDNGAITTVLKKDTDGIDDYTGDVRKFLSLMDCDLHIPLHHTIYAQSNGNISAGGVPELRTSRAHFLQWMECSDWKGIPKERHDARLTMGEWARCENRHHVLLVVLGFMQYTTTKFCAFVYCHKGDELPRNEVVQDTSSICD
jgi:hypothetical protein